MSLLPKIEAGLRGLQLLISLLFTVFWGWMRTQGFLKLWSTAPPGAYMFGTILFALGLIAGVWGVIAATANTVFLRRTECAVLGNLVHGGRIAVDFLAIGLLTAVRIMLSVIPAQFLPDILEPNNAATAKQFFVVQGATGVGLVLAM